MSNRLDHEFRSRDALGRDDLQVYARRARQARSEVIGQALRVGAAWIGQGARGLATRIVPVARRLGELLACAGYGAAKRWPDAGGCR